MGREPEISGCVVKGAESSDLALWFQQVKITCGSYIEIMGSRAVVLKAK